MDDQLKELFRLSSARPYRILAYGELLWDLLPTGPQLGGAPLNFAYRMSALGHQVAVVSRIGDDELGTQALSRLQAIGLDPSWIQVDPTKPTGTVHVQVRSDGSPDFEIVPDVAYDQLELTSELLSLAAESDCVCYGTLIQRSASARETLYAILDSAAGSIKVCDINLRRNCYAPETVRESIRRATIVKLSEDEIEPVAAILGIEPGPIDRFCEQLLADTRVALVVVTLAERGALAMSAGGRFHYEPGWRVNVVDTCGSGDAFTAGFVHALLQDADLRHACAFANVLGALVAETPGGTSPLDLRRAEAFLSGSIERIIDPRVAERAQVVEPSAFE